MDEPLHGHGQAVVGGLQRIDHAVGERPGLNVAGHVVSIGDELDDLGVTAAVAVEVAHLRDPAGRGIRVGDEHDDSGGAGGEILPDDAAEPHGGNGTRVCVRAGDRALRSTRPRREHVTVLTDVDRAGDVHEHGRPRRGRCEGTSQARFDLGAVADQIDLFDLAPHEVATGREQSTPQRSRVCADKYG